MEVANLTDRIQRRELEGLRADLALLEPERRSVYQAMMEDAMAEQKDILTLPDVAELLQVSQATVTREVQRGKLDGKKVGAQWRFTRESIDRYLRGEPVTSATDGATLAPTAREPAVKVAMAPVLLALTRHVLRILDSRAGADHLIRLGDVLSALGTEASVEQSEAVAVLRELEELGELELRPYNDKSRAIEKGILGINDAVRGYLTYIVLTNEGR